MPHTLFEQACEQSKGLATFDEIQQLLRDHIGVVSGTEIIALSQGFQRVLTKTIIAPRNIPMFSNSAIDGYAFAHASLTGDNSQLSITQEIFAGTHPDKSMGKGEAARIFTGATMPQGADTCLMQENAQVNGTILVVPTGIKPGANTRHAGEDYKTGEVVVKCGTRLTPATLGAVATTGINEIECRRTLKVAILSTGDEVIRPGNPINSSQIYDSNFHLLNGLAQSANIKFDDFGILADDKSLIFNQIEELSHSHDLIISTGGASVGDKDFIIAAIKKLGVLRSWKIAIKPGRPLAIGQIGKSVFLGLPGNPVAAFNTWLLFALPIIAYMQGANWKPPQRFRVTAGSSLTSKKTGRREFLRGWLENTDNGPLAHKFERDGSGLTSGLTKATGLIELPEGLTDVQIGSEVNFIPFSEFGLTS